MNPSLSFSLDERTVAALLQEDESTFGLLGSLLPGAASAALAAADAQHGRGEHALSAANAAAMQSLLQTYANQVGLETMQASSCGTVSRCVVLAYLMSESFGGRCLPDA